MTDELSDYRSEFPITEHYAFLSHAAVSSPSRRVSTALHAYLEQAQHQSFWDAMNNWLKLRDQLRGRIARFINARGSDEVIVMPNTATSINTAAVSLPLKEGDNVLVLDGDYPANIYPWQALAYRGVLTKVVPQHQGGLDLNILEQRIDRRTRVIALSTAMFASGFRNDIEAVGRLCKERGIYFVVDAIQTVGAFPLDVQACNIDFLACGSQKWLLSTPGHGFLYCRRELFPELEPHAYVGASSVVDPLNFLDYNLTLPDDAQRFEVGTHNMPGTVAMDAAIALLEEVGVEHISQHILRLIDTLINDLSERGYTFAASTAPEHRSGIVVVQVPDAKTLCQKFNQEGIIVTPRGGGVRVAPHFYNTFEEVLRVGEVLDAAGARQH